MDDPSWKPLDEKYLNRISLDKINKHKNLDKSHSITASYDGAVWRNSIERSQRTVIIGQFRRSDQEKTCTLTANMGT